MNLKTQSHDLASIVEFPQQLVMANAHEVRAELKTLIENGNIRLVLDLHGVKFIDSSGLSVLVSALKIAIPKKGKVVLLSPTDEVRALIELTRLHQVFDIYEDRTAAIEELNLFQCEQL